MPAADMLAAVGANNTTMLEPVNHATADRAPIWYYGHTQVLARGADPHDLTFLLCG